MLARFFSTVVVTAIVAILILFTGCEKEFNSLEPAPYPTDSEVYIDEFGPGIDYQAFGDSKVDALEIDYSDPFSGASTMKFVVPSVGDPAGFFAGGAFVNNPGRNLSGYNALTFWCRASIVATLGVAGFGNDNTGTSQYVATMPNLPVTTSWQKYTIPIPLPEKLQTERGMFQLAAGAQDGSGYDIWFDEVKFESLGTIAHPRPSMRTKTSNLNGGDSTTVEDTKVVFNVSGIDQTVECSAGYFTFLSSDDAVATVDEYGVIKAVGLGSANITAKLGTVDATGSITVNVGTFVGPDTPAPTPTIPADSVISLFSNAYSNHPVDTWNTGWLYSTAVLQDIQISGDDVKLYTDLNFVGIEFASLTVDASEMTNFHLDIWTPDPTAAPAEFRVQLVDFGPDGVFGGGDDSSDELVFTAATNPALASEQWVSLDMPLSDFTGLTGKEHLAQLVLSGDPNTVYVDNVYFHSTGDGGTSTGPTEPAPTPTVPPGNVISLFSNAYTNSPVDTWSADWDQADVADVQVSGDDVKLYTNLVFAGIEFTTQTVDATAMTQFHMDIWTPDPTTAPAAFKIKLVDFGADGMFGGGDDVEHELTFDENTTPALATGTWVGMDIPLSDFTGLTTKAHLAQMILSSDPNTVYVDNIYFYSGGTGTEPTTPAPSPTFPSGDVISLFSNPYTNVAVDTWSADWDDADVEDFQISGDDTKLYTNVVFAGIEFTSQTIDASAMTHFHLDFWTPDPTAAPAVFKIKLVDFGADGVFGGGDDVEHELTFDASTTPALATGSWVNFDIMLSDFTDLTTKGHLSQFIFVADPNTVYIDNLLFHK